MKISAKTDVGTVRTNNQDFCLAGEFSDGATWAVVCDGMGGANGGNIASETAAKLIFNKITNSYHEAMNDNSIKMLITSAIETANAAVYSRACSDETLKGMGTTVVLSIIKGDCLYYAHVGDSRLYIISDDKITQMTSDHSVIQMMIDNGEITAEDARIHPVKNVITRALGVDETVLLCTDGLTNYVDDMKILEICNSDDKYSLADLLVYTANANGGGDNVTVVTLSY